MADRKLTIEVEEKHVGQAVADATKQVNELKGAVDSSTEAHKEHDDATKGLGESLKETKEHLERAIGGHRTLHQVMHQVSEISPLMGAALKLALNPIGGAVLIAIGLFVKFKEHIDEVNKSLDEMGAAAAEPSFLAGIEAKKAAVKSAAEGIEAFKRSLADINSVESQYQSMVKESTQLLHERYAAQTKISDAAKGSDLQRIEDAVRAGRVSPTQAAIDRAAVEERYRKGGEGRSRAEAEDDLAMKEAELARQKGKTVPWEEKARAYGEAKGQQEDLADNLKFEKEKLNKLKEEAKKALADPDMSNPDLVAMPYGPAHKAAAKAVEERDRQAAVVAALDKQKKEADKALGVAEHDKAFTEGEENKRNAAIKALEEEIRLKRASLQITLESNKATEDAGAYGRGSKTLSDIAKSGAGGAGIVADISAAVAANQRVESGKGTVDDQNGIIAFVTAITGRTASLKQAEGYLDALKDNTVAQASLAEKVITFAEKLVDNNQSDPKRLAELELRIEQLASQLNKFKGNQSN